MFAKLLKHEWRATRGIIALLCVIILISGLTIGGTMHYLIGVDVANEAMVLSEEDDAATFEPMSDFAEVMCVLLIMAGFIAIAVCGAGSVFFLIYRFYKSRFTDEGYLTFTLPANHHQLLLSSFLNSSINMAIVILTAFLAFAMAVGLFLTAFPENLIWADVSMGMEQILQQLWASLLANGKEIALAAFSAVVGCLSELMLLMLAVTIGALIAKKHKILAAVGVYYGISMVQSFIYSLIAIKTTTAEGVDMFLASPGVMGLITAVCGYFLMHYLTSKKLNLA